MNCPKCGSMLWTQEHGDASSLVCRCGWESDTLASLVRASAKHRGARLKASGAAPGWYGPDGEECNMVGNVIVWRGCGFYPYEASMCGFVEVPHE